MLGFVTKKDRKILNLEAKVKNRDTLIDDQVRTIESLKTVINSLEDDLKSARSASYELIKDLSEKTNKKTPQTRKRAKKETTSKNTTLKK